MRLSITIATVFIASALAPSPVSAQGHGAHGRPAVTPANAPHSTATHTPTQASGKPKTSGAASHRTSPTTQATNPIAAKIASHPRLEAKVKAMLPAGVTLDRASAGFRNQGQFLAALHAVDHMHCATCFAQIKTDMVDKGMSLGRSIQDVRHTSSTTAEAQAAAAKHEADNDLKVTTASTSRKKPHGGDR